MNGVLRTVTIPPAQKMFVSDGEKVGQAEVGFVEFAKQIWLNDARLGQSIELLSAKETIAGKLEMATAETVELWENELGLLIQIAKQPSRPYNPADAKSVLVFFRALTEAVGSTPAEDKECVGG